MNLLMITGNRALVQGDKEPQERFIKNGRKTPNRFSEEK